MVTVSDAAGRGLLLHLIRTGQARTRAEASRIGNLGPAVVSRCVGQLIDLGLIYNGEPISSTGGRPAGQLCFNAAAGMLLVAEFGATAVTVGLTDLAGKMLATAGGPWRIEDGPDASIDHVVALMRTLQPDMSGRDVWGVGVGLPGPVEFATGRPTSPPIMPGWDGYDVRARLRESLGAPVWVDNDVNVMALGELRAGAAIGERDVVVIKIGTGIGAGLISEGRIHRGAQGSAGDVGHVPVLDTRLDAICRCGKRGCLEAVAGGAAIVRDGHAAAVQGRSQFLANVLSSGRAIGVFDVIDAAAHGDSACVDLLTTAAHCIGDLLVIIVNIYNPSLIVLGGSLTRAGDGFLAAIRQQVFLRSSPLATRNLRIVRSTLGQLGAATGTAHMVLDELFNPDDLAKRAHLRDLPA